MKKWNSELLEKLVIPEHIEIHKLRDGQAFQHGEQRYIKCADMTDGTRACIRLFDDGSVAIVKLDGYTPVLPLPYTSRLVIEPIENGGEE